MANASTLLAYRVAARAVEQYNQPGSNMHTRTRRCVRLYCRTLFLGASPYSCVLRAPPAESWDSPPLAGRTRAWHTRSSNCLSTSGSASAMTPSSSSTMS
eukprot:6143807-Prymnesium_polylepis.1